MPFDKSKDAWLCLKSCILIFFTFAFSQYLSFLLPIVVGASGTIPPKIYQSLLNFIVFMIVLFHEFTHNYQYFMSSKNNYNESGVVFEKYFGV